MVVADKVGFLLREKLTEFKADSVLPKLFSGDLDLAKPRLMFLKFGGVLDLDSARRKGSGE